MSNPLLENHRLPPFSAIKAEHVEPAIDHVLSTARNKIDTILSTLSDPSWETLVQPMEAMDALIDNVWSPVSHMNSVVISEDLR